MVFKPFLRLQTKISLVFSFLVIAIIAIFFSFAFRVYKSEEKAAVELRAISLASLLGQSITSPLYYLRFDQMRDLLESVLGQTYVLYVYAYDTEGRILSDGTKANQYFRL
jgi:sensor histidine kinase regulating citrate/malate metabolism